MTTSVLDAGVTTTAPDEATPQAPATKQVRIFTPGGTPVELPEVEGKAAAGYLADAGVKVGECDVVFINGRAVTPDTVVLVDGEATNVITVSPEIACG